LIQATDEDSDEDGNTLVKPVGINANAKPYEAPRLNIDTGPDSATLEWLKSFPRDKLTDQQR
jgi:hypothetical protein